ncbi:MAG: phospho-sugar mutase, partial [Actinomycetota bacterium]
MIPPELAAQVAAWIADDPDERDRADLQALLDDGGEAAGAELADRFGGRLEFGTAGLRGAVAAGPNRMNRAVVRGATAALAGWLLARHDGSADAGVVIGCDARHRSEDFYQEAALVLAGAGLRVHLLPPRQPTPLLAFAVPHLGAAAGIMITASHNPPADNGYKLYLADGAQIVPPADAEIEAAIRGLGPLAEVPVAQPGSPLIFRHGDELAAAYLDAVTAEAGMGGDPPAPVPSALAGEADAAALRYIYTPLHGVAAELALRAFAQAGFAAPHVVAAQAEPDPDFPTVAFPNPEVPGALDLAIDAARRTGADLVIANDPDGDRLAVAVPGPGGWQMLTGDQVGALLGAYVLDRTAGRPGADGRLVASTVVSGTLLARITAAAGARYAQTLTGFKWIVRAAEQRSGTRYVFGYEEALGYAIGTVVRDKDGIGAALAALGLAARAKSRGETLLDAYDALETAHGVHLTSQLTLATDAPGELMARLRDRPPAEFGALAVTGCADLSDGTPELPPSDLLSYQLDGGRVVIRPSGTEPKVKAYLEVTEPP